MMSSLHLRGPQPLDPSPDLRVQHRPGGLAFDTAAGVGCREIWWENASKWTQLTWVSCFFLEWFFLRLVNFLGFLETLLHEQIMQKGCPKLENNGEIPYWKIEGEHTTGQIQHTFKNSTCGKHGIIILTIERRNIASCNLKLWRKTKKIVYYSILWK